MDLTALFTDPTYMASTYGTILLSIMISFVGAFCFVQKQSLTGEVLSHASFPGLVLGTIVASTMTSSPETTVATLIYIVFALTANFLALYFIHFLRQQDLYTVDAVLCFTLSGFMGIGLLFGSILQSYKPVWFRFIQTFFYGQAATIPMTSVYLYAFLAITIGVVLFVFFDTLKVLAFDRQFAKSRGVRVFFYDALIMFILATAMTTGIRALGVVLISGMLVIPAIGARWMTNRFSLMILFSTLIAVASAIIGNALALMLSGSRDLAQFVLPTGPLIVVTAVVITLSIILVLSPRGLLYRIVKQLSFRNRCLRENILKWFWKEGNPLVSFHELKQCLNLSNTSLTVALIIARNNRWVDHKRGGYCLTDKGFKHAQHIVRVHRLWELYLTDEMSLNSMHVHQIAEDIEHILSDDFEKELSKLLKNPKKDPHDQPIPS